MLNIFYNTTRQWNCGDEFILLGVRRIMQNVYPDKHLNPVIYNRNPDIRPDRGDIPGYRLNKLPLENYPNIFTNSALFRTGFNDNSVKFDSDLSYADIAVIAGSPEWSTRRCINFYEHVIKNNIPTIFLGVGSMVEKPTVLLEEVLRYNQVFTYRDKNLIKRLFPEINNPVYLPCPALLSAPNDKEKTITEVKKIALNFVADYKHSVRNNSVNDKTYIYTINLYQYLLENFPDYSFGIVCHYIDEIPEATKIFAKYGVPIYYSYDSKEYIDIYQQFDLVVSPRVHACGICASMGIPGINIAHDFRGGTCEGFLSTIITNELPIEEAVSVIEQKIHNIAEHNTELKKHKQKTMQQYVQLIKENFKNQRINYNQEVLTDIYQDTQKIINSLAEIPTPEKIFAKIDSDNENIDKTQKVLTDIQQNTQKIIDSLTLENIYAISNLVKENFLQIEKSRKKRRQYPAWLIRTICCFIPKQKNRKRLRETYMKKKEK